jgi:CheY-like chemotaxis protein/chemotaxis signal transduction protein
VKLLCVDDSEAVLALERAFLASVYTVHTATNGRDALLRAAEVGPDAILLDLSMPDMDGEEAFARLAADPALRRIPVLFVSSELERGRRMVERGAAGFLPKPFQQDELLVAVARAIDAAERARLELATRILPVSAAGVRFALPLSAVRKAFLQPATSPVPAAPPFLRELVEVEGTPVFVLDVPALLSLPHASELSKRWLVLVELGETLLALGVDSVEDPLELEAGAISDASALGARDPRLAGALRGVARLDATLLPILDPRGLVTSEQLEALARLLPSIASPA